MTECGSSSSSSDGGGRDSSSSSKTTAVALAEIKMSKLTKTLTYHSLEKSWENDESVNLNRPVCDRG
jgi:hypothetical protein